MKTVESLPYLDLDSPDYSRDPLAALRDIREQSPIIGTRRGIEVLSYSLILELLVDDRMQPNYGVHPVDDTPTPALESFLGDGFLVNMSGAGHQRLRKVQAAAFRMRQVRAVEEMIREVARHLLDALRDRSSCDLVADFTHSYSIGVLCRLIGVPSGSIPEFEHATLAVGNIADPARRASVDAALEVLYDFVKRMLVERDGEHSDLIADLISAQQQLGRLSESELIWTVANLLFAGHDTTRYQLANVLHTLIREGVWDEIGEDESLVAGAVEEAIRYAPTVPTLHRVAGEDMVIEGIRISRGDQLRFNMLAASRDPDSFPDPDVFDMRRAQPGTSTQRGLSRGYDTFGKGEHYCLGANLATAEMRVAVELLTSSWTDLEVNGPMAWRSGDAAIVGPEQVPVRFAMR
jgi:cytochrome P450